MWIAIAILVLALVMVLIAPKPNIENARAAKLGDFQFPRSREGDPIPWFLGTVQLKSPNSLWFGDYKPVAITVKQKTGLFSSKRVVTGYKYHMGLDLCWALGDADGVELLKLKAGKYDLWSGTLAVASTISINLPELFGGEKQRGGMIGNIDFYPGKFTETRNTYLASKADADVPAYLGQSRLVFRGATGSKATGFYFGTSTNIEAISAEMRRLARNLHATYSVMPNGKDVNPMELLYVGFTQKWGMLGMKPDSIDLTSWIACATTLYNEGLGMSLLVQTSITGKDIVEEVLRIADGILYQDPTTGKLVAKLIREDYVIGDLPILDQTVISQLNNFSKTTWEGTYNQCRVTFKDRDNDYADKVAVAQDFANINFQQKVRNIGISVPGCFVNDTGNLLASRQLSLLSIPLFTIELSCNRKASNLKPGGLFVFNWAPYGISNMVMRVQKIDLGTLTDGTVTIHAIQDRYAIATAVFAPPGGSEWTPITSVASPVTNRVFTEMPYWFSQFMDTVPTDTQAMVYALAAPPSSASVEMDIDHTTNADSTWLNPIIGLEDAPYNGSGILQAAYDNLQGFSTGIDATGFILHSVDEIGSLLDRNGSFDTAGQMLLYMNGEIMSTDNITDNLDGTYTLSTINRALFDTTFVNHAISSRCYFIIQGDGLLPAYFDDTSAFRYRIIDNTPDSTLATASALVNVLTNTRRCYKVAPVKYLTLNGSRAPAAVDGESIITADWRSRNRKTLTVTRYNSASETAEPGTDYRLRWRVNAGAWSAGVYTSALTYPITGPGGSGIFDVEVYARRDGLLSINAEYMSIALVETFLVTEASDQLTTESGDTFKSE